ncbi:16S rRNA (guanine(966)-N(2))-methyltransferase RsmD [Synechocystis sp. PCC 7509]|uniref:16S rRNA (guanine(966)-N(2))-methyltransferase RsmD n=1 Tax=Synechocystis sp. PCC 7509 TaxID=927677 RepID=UPI0002AC9A1D|nr:16S rRNA (guanine(966)-N(2))-methyltransferase RsmD [Synechocystis sp. PCC 7509]
MSLRISGNRQLKTLPGLDTRPTSSRVRSALFNIWQGEIDNCSWLDLCAGSGAMSAEALSRGAKSVTCIEQSSRACTIIGQNLQQIAINQTFQVLKGDVLQRLKSLAGQQFDRIYFDPPYASNLYQPVLEEIAVYKLLHPDGELAVEHSPSFELPQITTLEICLQKVYGHTAVTFYCPSPS